MEFEQIMTYVTAFFGSTVGATLIGCIAKWIINKVGEVKIAKQSKLSNADKAEIAKTVSREIEEAFSGGVKIDVDTLMTKYTSGRIDKLEQAQNEIVSALDQVKKYAKTTMSAVGDFKTISLQSKGEIASLLKESDTVVSKIESVAEPIVEMAAETKKPLKY